MVWEGDCRMGAGENSVLVDVVLVAFVSVEYVDSTNELELD